MTTQGKTKMAGVRLEEIELMEAWSEENPEVRAKFDFPLTAATGCTSSSVIYYVIEPGHRTPLHIHSCEEIQGHRRGDDGGAGRRRGGDLRSGGAGRRAGAHKALAQERRRHAAAGGRLLLE